MKRKIHSIAGMTESGASAIWIFAHNTVLYRDINFRLLSQDREYVTAHYFPFLRIFLSALTNLMPVASRTLYKGIKGDLLKERDDVLYECGSRFVWWTCASVTADRSFLDSDAVLGTEGKRTIFVIETAKGADVGAFGGLDSDEIFLPPGIVLRVSKIDISGDLTVIHCQDDMECVTLIR